MALDNDDNGNPISSTNISNSDKLARIKSLIKSYPDFPKPGILFRDFLPIFRHYDAVTDLIELLAQHLIAANPDAELIVGLESRGFLIGPLLATRLRLPFVPIRKAGKLPGVVEKLAYELEYGEDTFEIQKEAIRAGSKCVLIDDLLATGGSLQTSIKLIDKCGASVVKSVVIIELAALNGRSKLESVPLFSLITY